MFPDEVLELGAGPQDERLATVGEDHGLGATLEALHEALGGVVGVGAHLLAVAVRDEARPLPLLAQTDQARRATAIRTSVTCLSTKPLLTIERHYRRFPATVKGLLAVRFRMRPLTPLRPVGRSCESPTDVGAGHLSVYDQDENVG